MWNLRIFDFRVWMALFLSIAFGFIFLQFIYIFDAKPLFLLALPVVGVFFVFLVVKPEWILISVVLSRPLLDNLLNSTKTNVGGENIGIGAILNLVIIILAVFLTFQYSSFPHHHRSVFYWLVFLFFMLMASLYSPYVARAIRLFLNYVSYFAMFLIPFLVIKGKEDFLFWLKIFAWSFILPVFGANLDLLHGGHYFQDAGMRISGTFTHPNILAFYLVLGLTFYFYMLKGEYWRSKPGILWAIRILMLNMLVLLIATKSRNAWLACISIFLIYGLLKDRKFLIMLFILLPLSLVVPQVQDRVMTVLQDKESNNYQGLNSFEWRLQIWKSSLSKIAQRPLQGYGLTTFKPMSEQFFSEKSGSGAHNAYLETLFESGIFGFLSFILLLLSPLKMFLNNMFTSLKPRQARLWAILAGYMISYMIICFADNLSYYLVLNWYVWFFIGLMLVSERFSHD